MKLIEHMTVLRSVGKIIGDDRKVHDHKSKSINIRVKDATDCSHEALKTSRAGDTAAPAFQGLAV